MHDNQVPTLKKKSHRTLLRPAHSILKAEIYLETIDDKQTIVKDFSSSPLLIRKTLGRFVFSREIRTLGQLSSIENVPDFIESISPHAYRMQYIEGVSPKPAQFAGSTELLGQLSQLVDEMHQKGVTHNDIRMNNMILTSSNTLYLIDFGAVWFRPKCQVLYCFLGHWFFNYLQRTDDSKVSRLKLKYNPSTITKEDEDLILRTAFSRKTTRLWKKHVLPLISPSKHRHKK